MPRSKSLAGPASPRACDVDLLVVMEVQGSVVEKRLQIRGTLHDIPVPVDVAVTTPEDFALRKDLVGTLEWPATREGKLLYDRTGSGYRTRSRMDRQG